MGYLGDGFKGPTNSMKVLKERRYKRKENPEKSKQPKIQQHNRHIQKQQVP